MKNLNENGGRLTKKVTPKELFTVINNVEKQVRYFIRNVDEFNTS